MGGETLQKPGAGQQAGGKQGAGSVLSALTRAVHPHCLDGGVKTTQMCPLLTPTDLCLMSQGPGNTHCFSFRGSFGHVCCLLPHQTKTSYVRSHPWRVGGRDVSFRPGGRMWVLGGPVSNFGPFRNFQAASRDSIFRTEV